MKFFYVIIGALIFFQTSVGQNTNSNVVAELKVETIEDISSLTARAFNSTDLYVNLRYVFSVIRFDENYKSAKVTLEEFLKSEDISKKTLEDFIESNNISQYTNKESQEDFFTLDPYQSKDLIDVLINTATKNKIIVLLLIYDEDDNIVARSRVVFNEKNENINKDDEDNSQNGFVLTGIVLEETLTKNGKDFYDRFYHYYSNNRIKGDEIVIIDEMFTFRTRTKINVKIGDVEIFSFFGSSNEEYIDEMAIISVRKVSQYFEIKKKQKSYITRY